MYGRINQPLCSGQGLADDHGRPAGIGAGDHSARVQHPACPHGQQCTLGCQKGASDEGHHVGAGNGSHLEQHQPAHNPYHRFNQTLVAFHPSRGIHRHGRKCVECFIDSRQQACTQRRANHLDAFGRLLGLLLGGVSHGIEFILQALRVLGGVAHHFHGFDQTVHVLDDLRGRTYGFIAKEHFHGGCLLFRLERLETLHDLHDGFFWSLLHDLGQLFRVHIEHVEHLNLALGGCKPHGKRFHEVLARGGCNLFSCTTRQHGGRQGCRLGFIQSHGRQVGALALQHPAHVHRLGVHIVGNMVDGTSQQRRLVHAQVHAGAPGLEHFARLLACGVKGHAHLGRHISKLVPLASVKAGLAGCNVGAHDFFACHASLDGHLLGLVSNGAQLLRGLAGHLVELGQALLPVHRHLDGRAQRGRHGHAVKQRPPRIAARGHVALLRGFHRGGPTLMAGLGLECVGLPGDAGRSSRDVGAQLALVLGEVLGADAGRAELVAQLLHALLLGVECGAGLVGLGADLGHGFVHGLGRWSGLGICLGQGAGLVAGGAQLDLQVIQAGAGLAEVAHGFLRVAHGLELVFCGLDGAGGFSAAFADALQGRKGLVDHIQYDAQTQLFLCHGAFFVL